MRACRHTYTHTYMDMEMAPIPYDVRVCMHAAALRPRYNTTTGFYIRACMHAPGDDPNTIVYTCMHAGHGVRHIL